MRFNLVKQSLIPAFLTLVVWVVLTCCCTPEVALSTIEEARHGLSAEELPIPPLGARIASFQHNSPRFAHWITAFLMLFTGITLGRLTLRYKFYGSGTCLAIPIYGMVMCGALGSGQTLFVVVLSLLTTLAVKNLCMSHRNGFGFDRIFRGALFLALLLIVEPTAAPMLVAIPMAVTHFRRTTRETIVAVAGLLFPFALLCYLNWALGGSFTAPLVQLYRAFMAGHWLQALVTSTTLEQAYVGVLLLLALPSTILFYTNSYSINTKARHMLLFTCRLFWWLPTLFLLPAASAQLVAIWAVPASLLLPVLFVRVHLPIAQTLYLLLSAASIAVFFLQ